MTTFGCFFVTLASAFVPFAAFATSTSSEKLTPEKTKSKPTARAPPLSINARAARPYISRLHGRSPNFWTARVSRST